MSIRQQGRRRICMHYDKRKVTIVVPSKNEGEGLAGVLRQMKRYAHTVIVVDGHSTDDTKNIARKSGASYCVDHGQGRGEAVRVGLARAKSEIVVVADGDGSTESSDIPALVLPILNRQADMVIASRRTGGSLDIRLNFDGLVRLVGSDVLTYLINQKLHTHFTDAIYSFRAIRTTILPHLHLQSNGHAIEQEMVVSCMRKGYRVREIPSREKARGWGVSNLKTLTGLELLYQLIRQLYW